MYRGSQAFQDSRLARNARMPPRTLAQVARSGDNASMSENPAIAPSGLMRTEKRSAAGNSVVAALVITGLYQSRPPQLSFRLRYIREGGAWKLITIKVNVNPGG